MPAISSILLSSSVAATQLPTIQVTGEYPENAWFFNPTPVTVISQDDIQRSLAHSTPDAFATALGVYIQKTNQGGGSPFIRGLTGKHVLILIDGVRLNNSFYRAGPHQYLNTLEPSSIERIEVLRGPGSVRFGSDALGGVINIVTKAGPAADSEMSGNLQLSADTATDGVAGGIRLGGGLGDSPRGGSLWGGLRAKSLDDLDPGGDAPTETPSAYEEFSGDLAWAVVTEAGAQIKLSAQLLRQFSVPKTSEVTLGSKNKFDYEPQTRALAMFDYQNEQTWIFDRIRANLSLNYQEEGEEIIARSTPERQTTETTQVVTPGLLIHLEKDFNSTQRTSFGLQYYRDQYQTRKFATNTNGSEREELAPGTPDGAHYQSLGLYAQYQGQLSDRVQGEAGLRYSYFDTEGEVGEHALALNTSDITASTAINWAVSPGWLLTGRIAQGFRAPNMEDFFGRVDFFSEIPNTALEPEKSINYDLGLRFQRERLSGELFAFLSDYDDLISRVTVDTNTDGDPIKQRRNVDQATIRGVEFALQWSLSDSFHLASTATYTHGEDDDGEPLRRIPPLNGSFSLGYQVTPTLNLESVLVWAYGQDRLSGGDIDDARIPDGGTPGYGVFHLRGRWQPRPAHTINFIAENLADKAYKSHGSGLLAPGRSLRLSYRYDFSN